MDKIRDKAEFDRRRRAQEDEAFEQWLESPMVKMGISFVPPNSEYPEALMVLLKSCFHAGFSNGAGASTGDFMSILLRGMSKQEKGDRS